MQPQTSARVNIKQAIPFFMVNDIKKSLGFYVDGIGFAIKNKWINDGKLRWCWLQLGDAAIMLQEFWREGHEANMPQEKLGVGVSVYFICEDALSIYHEITSRGVAASEPFVGNNMWVTRVKDPDGYNLYFESSTDVPEETKYSDWKNDARGIE
jgi:lactoylglutathione lyase